MLKNVITSSSVLHFDLQFHRLSAIADDQSSSIRIPKHNKGDLEIAFGEYPVALLGSAAKSPAASAASRDYSTRLSRLS